MDQFGQPGVDKRTIEEAVEKILTSIGLIKWDAGKPSMDEGIRETPQRVAKSFEFLCSGYDQKPEDIIKTFAADGYDQLILLKDIELYSLCEHHILPFVGRAHIAYIPSGKLLGLSKLARLVEMFARRLQIQERLGDQIVQTLWEAVEPVGAACIITAEHFCMRMRGVNKQNSTMTTSHLKGRFLEDSDPGRAARAELMGLIGNV